MPGWKKTAQFILRHLAVLAIIAVSTVFLLAFNRFLSTQVIALIYLLPVMVSTVYFGLTPGVLAGFAAFLVFNFFFIPPYHTLAVHHTEDLISLLIFLVVAVVMSQIIGMANDGTRLAKRREWEATRMYELTSVLSGLQNIPELARALAFHTFETLQPQQVEVYIDPKPDGAALLVRWPAESTLVGRAGMRKAMVTARGLQGEIRLWLKQPELSEEEERLLETIASQGALAIERSRMDKIEKKAMVFEESDRLKSSLLSSVSHELRSPLATIKASISSLRSGMIEATSPAGVELIEMIDEESDKLNQLVGNMLDMSRIEAGALRPQRKWNSLPEIITNASSKLKKQLGSRTVKVRYPDQMPLVPSDYVQIEQVFSNLFSNSIKYSAQDAAIHISISISVNRTAMVRLANQSPNLPEENLERIFDKFYRASPEDRVTSTGLGLSICKGIIEAHGGKIWAENTPAGLAFLLTLPLILDGVGPMYPEDIQHND